MNIPCRNEKGFTLIEMLIALGLGLVVIGAAIGVFNYSQNSYNVQEDIAAMQQDVRVAKTFVERDLRMAGSGLEAYPVIGTMTAEDITPFTLENGQGENGTDILTIRYVKPDPDACGLDPDTSDGIDQPCSNLPGLHAREDMPENSAEAKVLEVLENEPYSRWNDGCYCNDKTYTSPSFGFTFIITTPEEVTPSRSEVVFLTGVTDNKHNFLQNHDVMDEENNKISNKIINSFPENSTISFYNLKPINVFRYFVQGGVLMRQEGGDAPQPVAEHIEDFQFAFGLDTDDDKVIDYWVDGSDSDDMDGDNDLTEANKLLVRAIRLSVMGRTAKARRELAEGVRPAIEDHAAADAADFHRRRLSQTTVELRNIGL